MVLASTTSSLLSNAARSGLRCSCTSIIPRLPSATPSSSSSSITSLSKARIATINGQWSPRAVQRRHFQTSTKVQHGGITRPEPGTGIKITFQDSKGNVLKSVEANEGDDLLSIAHEYDVDLEGACEGSIACSTCHIILDSSFYDKLEEPGDDENDMLDLAFGLTDT
jgi:ferredoxin